MAAEGGFEILVEIAGRWWDDEDEDELELDEGRREGIPVELWRALR